MSAGEQVEPRVPPAADKLKELAEIVIAVCEPRVDMPSPVEPPSIRTVLLNLATKALAAPASVSSPTPPLYDDFDNLIDVDYVDRTVDGENTTLMRNLIYRLWERVSSPTPTREEIADLLEHHENVSVTAITEEDAWSEWAASAARALLGRFDVRERAAVSDAETAG